MKRLRSHLGFWEDNACQAAFMTNGCFFVRGVPERSMPLSADSSAVHWPAHTSMMTQSRTCEDRGQRGLSLLWDMCTVHEDQRHESFRQETGLIIRQVTNRYREDLTNRFLRHLSCSVGNRWPMTAMISFCLQALLLRSSAATEKRGEATQKILWQFLVIKAQVLIVRSINNSRSAPGPNLIFLLAEFTRTLKWGRARMNVT